MTNNYGMMSKYGIVREERLEDPDRIVAKPYSPDQIAANKLINIPTLEVQEAVKIARSYKLGAVSASFTRYARRVEHNGKMRTGNAKAGIHLFTKAIHKISKPEDIKILENIIDRLTEELKE